MRISYLLLPALTLIASPALAQDRDFCANRPGIGTPACTMAPGTAMIETGVVEWDHSSDPSGSQDSTTLGEFLLRIGVSQRAEIQFGLDSLVLDREHDRASGLTTRHSNVGDLFLGVRRGLAGPNGPVAIQTFISAPAYHPGQWTTGILLPAGFGLPGGFQLALTPEVDLPPDADGHGHHFAYGGVLGVSHALGGKFNVGGELAAFEDADPTGHSLDARVAGELAWQVAPLLQFDVEADAGLSAGAPDMALMIGFADRFR